ncbi:MAG: LemA family protein [Candidatus Marsarchaeota archaeon]|nr:LemA family protein [Candidatus Marsarchaeota archaeon]
MSFSTILTFAIGIFLVIIAGLIILIYNTLINVKNNVNKAWANIDVLLEKRHDLIGQLVETVKGYMKYEKNVLEEVTKLRGQWEGIQDDSDNQNKMNTSNQISQALKSIFAVAENYPNLKTDQQFQELQKAITNLENQIADRREFYNDAVNAYNIKIQVIPYNLFSSLMRLQNLPYFQAPEEVKKPVKTEIK